ncbi:L,D-transpeptidase family protein [Thalassotalea sediminis]|uniref:L,D-transpeptidase family protein n=1 Tax=Thalassotalea sediminis TaxID=1759089 RepID=UPI002572E556|nr:L,D-transpeptidase family protein [Thalassotalea sediminis]
MMFLRCLSFIFTVGFALYAHTSVYLLPNADSRVIGEDIKHEVLPGDYFQALAEYYDVGLLALIEANPNVDPFLPTVGDTLVIPKRMILPFGERKGIIINLPELRLYYFPPNESLVYVFPVGIGREGLSTPKITSVIGDKRKDPIWRPPEALRKRYREEHGVELAKEILPGPNNPFGKYALRIDTSEYLIHGTNKRMGIGLRASSGCIRMYAPDIEWLYHNVAVGTQIKIIDQPIKMAYQPNGKKLIEVHKPLKEYANKRHNGLSKSVRKFLGEATDSERIQQILTEQKGLVYTLM